MKPSALLLDLDGTIYQGESLIPGSLEFLEYLLSWILVNYTNLRMLDEIYNTVDIFDRKDLEEHIIIKAKGSKESFNKLLAKLKT